MEPCIAVSAAQAVQKVVSIADVDDPRRITTSLLSLDWHGSVISLRR